MITPSYGITATERVLPKVTLDFTSGVLDSRITIARALNTATAVNSSGYVAVVNADLPRFDYNPTTLACRGLLIEETRTNLALQSQTFNTASWTKVVSTVSADSANGPDNALTADKLIPDLNAAFGTTNIQQSFSKAASAITYTWSVFGKADGFDRILLRCQDSGGSVNSSSVIVNISTGAITSAASALGAFTSPSAKVDAYANGFFRVQLTFTSSTDTFLRALVYPTDTTATKGDGVKGVLLYGAQLEVGAFPTSYIITTTTSVARNADVAVMTGTNFSDWYVSGQGSFFSSLTPKSAAGVKPILQADDGTANNLISLRGNVADPELYILSGGAVQAQIDAGTIVANTAYKLVGAWNTNSCAAAKDGGAAGTDASATIPTPNQLRIGSDGTNYANAWLANIQYWPQRLTDGTVQAFSK